MVADGLVFWLIGVNVGVKVGSKVGTVTTETGKDCEANSEETEIEAGEDNGNDCEEAEIAADNGNELEARKENVTGVGL